MTTLTVFTITNVRIAEHIDAVLKTARALPFKTEKLIVCPNRPEMPDDVRWETVPEFSNWRFPASLNNFLLRRLVDFTQTDAVLYVHDDGFARNPGRWTDEFLIYDYIGAPWPAEWCRDNRVGNGGFSIRSRALLELCKTSPEITTDPEDVHICRTHYDWFLQHRCRFAPTELALRFSFESVIREFPRWTVDQSFGFHGKHLLPR